jgi:hypothetical protein
MADSYLANIQALQSALAKLDPNSVAAAAIRDQIATLANAQAAVNAGQAAPPAPSPVNNSTTTSVSENSIDKSPAPVPAEEPAVADQISGIDTSPATIPNYVVIQNAETNFWDVVDPETGTVVAGNLPDEATAQETAGLQQSLVSSPSVSASSIDQSAAPIPTYVVIQNSDTGLWDVVDPATGTVVSGNLPDEATANEVLGLQQSLVSSPPVPQPQATGQDPYGNPNGFPYDDNGNLNPGWTLDENNNPVYVGGDFVEPATLASAEQSRIAAQVLQAQKQNGLSKNPYSQQNNLDWRLRLSLAPNANYLYADKTTGPDGSPNAGILLPLAATNGVIFPYTPQINTSYKANYNNYDLTHSNYRGYFYQNSYADTVTLTATFTAQNTSEANYLLAVIHFFRSVTKMFYGQSQNLGSPPPVCFLNGFGQYQFNKHPVLVTQFNYMLPADVDYIRAGSSNNLQLNQTQLTAKTNTLNPSLSSVQRLATSFLSIGAKSATPAPTQPVTSNATTANNNPTYVPTKMEIVLTLLPIQSRAQVSQQFNLQTFASGQLLKGGFW